MFYFLLAKDSSKFCTIVSNEEIHWNMFTLFGNYLDFVFHDENHTYIFRILFFTTLPKELATLESLVKIKS